MRCLPLLFVCLSACTTLPELGGVASSSALSRDYPSLLPIDVLLARQSSGTLTDEGLQDVNARLQRLRARAARLRGPVIDRQTRVRLNQTPIR